MLVNTVLGPITRDQLGITATHEHILLDQSNHYQAVPTPGITDPENQKVEMWNLGILSRDCFALKDNTVLDDEAVQTEEAAFLKRAGGDTLVDASLPGIGRDPQVLRRVSEKTGLNVIMGTGFYVGATHPEKLQYLDEREIADIMVGELTEGVDGTGIRAGYIGEIGISEVFDHRERKVLRAAAIAQKETGTAINVHINPWTTHGLEAAQILLDAGVAADRICISHVDVENREDYILALLEKGVYVEFDNFGKEYYIRREVRNPGYGLFVHDTDRVKLLKKLIDMGWLRQLLLSCDVCLKNLLHKYGGWGYDHVLTNIVPMMEDEGITDRQIRTMLADNPADWLFGREEQ